jgi:CBS domain-containing protein
MLSVQKLLDSKPSKAVYHVRPEQMVIEALELMAQNNIGAVMVMDGDCLVGIFSERDYARKGIIQGRKAQKTPITEVMTPYVFTVSPKMDIEDCMKLYSEKKIRHLPVVDDGKVVGMLSVGDLVKVIIREQDAQIEYLEQYIAHG